MCFSGWEGKVSQGLSVVEVKAALCIAVGQNCLWVLLTPSFWISENRRLSTTLCLPRPVSIIIVGTTLSWAQRVENTTECAHWPSLTQVIASCSVGTK